MILFLFYTLFSFVWVNAAARSESVGASESVPYERKACTSSSGYHADVLHEKDKQDGIAPLYSYHELVHDFGYAPDRAAVYARPETVPAGIARKIALQKSFAAFDAVLKKRLDILDHA